MTKSQKIAIARIFDDLIKADRIVDTGEMAYWKDICEKYIIDRDVKIASRDLSFADAVNTICASKLKRIKEELYEDCKAMTISDGFCAHSEALIMISLKYMFDPNQMLPCEVFSIPETNFNIDTATALYIENEYYPETNDEINRHYRMIFKEFQLAGFHFLYIPKIISHYKHTEASLVKDILAFLSPSLSKEGVENTYDSLMQMRTDIFCKDLLCNKCGIIELRNSKPSLLIKVGHSYVGEILYANYLKIEVDEKISKTVENFIDAFSSMLSGDIVVVNSSGERDNQFQFHGFYKQLLDIYLVRKNIRSSIYINPHKEEIFFPDIDAKAKGLHRRERALYALLLCQGSSGINFKQPKTVFGLAQYNQRMNKIQKRYAIIYEMFGGQKETAPDLRIPEIRRPIISCLKRAIRNLQGLYNAEDYNITKSNDGLISVNIEPELIYVNQLTDKNPVRLKDSQMFRKCSEI